MQIKNIKGAWISGSRPSHRCEVGRLLCSAKLVWGRELNVKEAREGGESSLKQGKAVCMRSTQPVGYYNNYTGQYNKK